MDWKERGHKELCPKRKKAAPSVVPGPITDVARARAASASAAPPAPSPAPDDGAARCPVCLEDWDANEEKTLLVCCCQSVCLSCDGKLARIYSCPLCRAPPPMTNAEQLARLTRHVDAGNPTAILQLGSCVANGQLGLEPNFADAARLYERAARHGEVRSLNNLGTLYGQGRGVERDEKKMVEYYRIAAGRGYAKAQCNLALCFFFGLGVANDYAKAAQIFELAAAQGYTEAESKLGYMHATGKGVPLDTAEALRYLELAAAKGDAYALEMLVGGEKAAAEAAAAEAAEAARADRAVARTAVRRTVAAAAVVAAAAAVILARRRPPA